MRAYGWSECYFLPLLVSLSVAFTWNAAAQTELRLAYTGGLEGYYRNDLPDGQKQIPALLKASLTADANTLILGMGDNFAPEFGASLIRTDTGKFAYECPQASSADRPKGLYKTDKTAYKHAGCDNVASFLMGSGYRALVPGREDFIYGSIWLENLGLLLAKESNAGGSADYKNAEHKMHLLAANLRLEVTPEKTPLPGQAKTQANEGNAQADKNKAQAEKTICPLLFSDPATWEHARGCSKGMAGNPKAAPSAKGSNEMKDAGYTITTLGGHGLTLIVGVVDTGLVDAVSTENKTFCGNRNKSTKGDFAGVAPRICPAKDSELSAKVKVTDPLQAVEWAVNDAEADKPPEGWGAVVVMAQMSRGNAEELAAKLLARHNAEPLKFPPVTLALSGAYADQSTGNFALTSDKELTQIPVLTPHPAYDTGRYNFEAHPMVEPASFARLTRGVNGGAGYRLESVGEGKALPGAPAAHSTLNLLLKEVAKVQKDPEVLKRINELAAQCDADRLTDLNGSVTGQISRIDQCDMDGIQYLLKAMQAVRSDPADVAMLERRDFFFGVMPQEYEDYSLCEGLDDRSTAKCMLNVALDRVLWKGDYLEKVQVKGSDLTTMIATSIAQSNLTTALAEPTTHGTWLTTFGLVTTAESGTIKAKQSSQSFNLPEDQYCMPSSTDPTKPTAYCVNGVPVVSDGSYWLVTSDHVASDTATYTNLAALPKTYDRLQVGKDKQKIFLTEALTAEIFDGQRAPAVDQVPIQQEAAALMQAGGDQDPTNVVEIADQERLHFQMDFGKIFFGYLTSSADGGDQYIANNFQGVTDSRASAVSQRELDAEAQLRGLWTWGHLGDWKGPQFGAGFQTDTEYDRAAQGNLNGTPSNASYGANNFAIGPLLQFSVPVRPNPLNFGNLGFMQVARLGSTTTVQYQQQLHGNNLYFGFSTGTNELVVPTEYSHAINYRTGVRLEAEDTKKWYQLSASSYVEFGPEYSAQYHVLSGLTLVNAPLGQSAMCDAKSTTTISACFTNFVKVKKTLTINANTVATGLTYANEPAGGLYWDIHLKRQLRKPVNQMGEIDLTVDTKGDAFFRRGARTVLSTQTFYDIPLNVALTFQALPNLSFAPAINFFYYSNQLAQNQLLIRQFSITARWYYDRDSRVPFLRQLLFLGPASADQTKTTKMKQP